jgi:translation initiation factor eIF-2B subunit delta
VVAKSGSALVAMECSIRNVPLVVLCESYKFSEKVHLDSFVYNESIEGDSKASIEEEDEMYFTTIEKKAKAATYPPYSKIKYDLTPSELVSVVVTEVGLIPSTSVPVVIREGFKIKK